MDHTRLSAARVRQILAGAHQTRVLVIGDAMLDHFIRQRLLQVAGAVGSSIDVTSGLRLVDGHRRETPCCDH